MNALARRFVRCTFLVQDWALYASRAALILYGTDSKRCWKHPCEILLHIHMFGV